MDALTAMLTRTTVPQAMMGEPGPSGDALDAILKAGAAAPDHGRLRPWRFLVIRGEARRRLGSVFAEALRRREPGASAAALEKAEGGPSRAPLIVAVVAAVVRGHKVPAVEQAGSAAAAAQNMLLAAHASGFAGKWSTGDVAYDPFVNERLGLGPDELLIGYLYFGTSRLDRPAPERPDHRAFVREWQGVSA